MDNSGDVVKALRLRAEKYSENARVARNAGRNSEMDWADGMKHAFFIAARMVEAALKQEKPRLTDGQERLG